LERYAALQAQVDRLIASAYNAVASKLPVHGTEGNSYAIFNSLSWARDGWIKFDGQWIRANVPSMGYAVSSGLEQAKDFEEVAASTGVGEILLDQTVTGAPVIQNDLLVLTFASDGSVASIYDKEHRREVVPQDQKANALRVYHDPGDAWDFRQDYRQTDSLSMQLEESVPYQDGPTAGLIQRYRFGQSTLTQKVVLTHGSRRIDFVTHVDWQESGKMLRTSFPVQVRSDTVSCEIQFGYLKRPTHRNTMWDYAKDEICAHHWVDLSEPDYGVALLNDCKYGHRAEKNVLDLNLLRSTSYPDPEADRAEHHFTYALYPHKGDHVQAEVYKQGYDLNVPLQVIPLSAESGEPGMLPLSKEFLYLDHPNVMVETVKKTEDGEDLIIRLYETAGTHAATTLHFGFDVLEVWEADLMEVKLESIPVDEGKVELTFTPFEIKTLRLTNQAMIAE
jgi:alpha-mannosidase